MQQTFPLTNNGHAATWIVFPLTTHFLIFQMFHKSKIQFFDCIDGLWDNILLICCHICHNKKKKKKKTGLTAKCVTGKKGAEKEEWHQTDKGEKACHFRYGKRKSERGPPPQTYADNSIHTYKYSQQRLPDDFLIVDKEISRIQVTTFNCWSTRAHCVSRLITLSCLNNWWHSSLNTNTLHIPGPNLDN